LAFPKDRIAHGFELQFMLGDSILFAPCVRPDNTVDLYLPEGGWVSFPDNQDFNGAQRLTLNLRVDQMAIFVKQGHNIPLGQPMEHTGGLDVSDQAMCELSQWPSVSYYA
jgi:alpha-D-xyloside xylohydrolase